MVLSVQDQAIQLVIQKGMTIPDAIAEIEAKLNGRLPDNIRLSIRNAVDFYEHYHPHLKKGMLDLTEKCYFCGKRLGEEYYCYGCGWWCCNSCDFGHPVGEHNIKDHLVDENGKTYNDTIKHLLEQKGD